jgi:holliday junction DNA helicase RuvA
MIAYITGKLISKKPAVIIVETSGVGYEIHITLNAYEGLPAINDTVRILTHFHIKDNPFTFTLYGFSDERERECFRQIISVSGIGPKTAMTVLSAINYNEFIDMISSGNYLPLTSVSGVGRKTAERLAVELKDKIAKSVEETQVSASSPRFVELSKASEVIQALIALGYNRLEADKMVKNITGSNGFGEMSVEQIIKEVLRGK